MMPVREQEISCHWKREVMTVAADRAAVSGIEETSYEKKADYALTMRLMRAENDVLWPTEKLGTEERQSPTRSRPKIEIPKNNALCMNAIISSIVNGRPNCSLAVTANAALFVVNSRTSPVTVPAAKHTAKISVQNRKCYSRTPSNFTNLPSAQCI